MSAILSHSADLARRRPSDQVRRAGGANPYEQDYDTLGHGDLIARYRNGAPDSVLVFNTPVNTNLSELEAAAFVQDSWTIAQRLTINAGARFERLTGGLKGAIRPAGQFVARGTSTPGRT